MATDIKNHGGRGRGNTRKRKNNWDSRNGRSRRSAEGTAVGAAAPSKIFCSVCTTVEAPKYKCPKCRDIYCSIQCCRDHKARGCNTSKASTAAESESSPLVAAPSSKYLPKEEIAKFANINDSNSQRDLQEHDNDDTDDEDLEDGWKITELMTNAIQNSGWLKKELKDEGLRHLIRRIVASSSFVRRNQKMTKQEDELEQLKTDYPRFKGFVDKLLVLTDVLERHGQDAEVNLNEWLQQEGRTESAQLTLKPVACEGVVLPPLPDDIPDDDDTVSSDEETSDSESSSAASSAR